MSFSEKQKKSHIRNVREMRAAAPYRPNGFSVRYASKSDTPQLKITLKGASVNSKAPISLPKTPWDAS